jgi:regulator of sigma E protease
MGILELIAAFLVVFIPLVIIHEAGHMLACKMVGISVVEFGIGFPPRIATLFRWKETVFTLNAIPFGGFVIPFGEDMVRPQGEGEMKTVREELMERGVENPKSVFEATPLQKIWFLIAGILANLLTAWLIFMAVPLVLGIPFAVYDVSITDVYPDSEAALKALREGDVVTAVNGESFRSSYDLEDEVTAYLEANPGAPVVFSIYRPLTDQRFDVEMTPVNVDQEAPQERVRILEVQSNSPALEAGLLADDIILQANGQEITSLEQMQEITAANEGQAILVTVERNKEPLEISVTPRRLEGESQARIGITINFVIASPAFGFVVDDSEEIVGRDVVHYNLLESIEYGSRQFAETVLVILRFPRDLITGALSLEEARPVSVVGISQITVQIIRDEPIQIFMNLVGLISISLAITNLLPIPGLDGGRILFVLIEIIRGKPMEPEREGLVHLMGFLFVFTLGMMVIAYDIINPIQLQ